jgi:hypothetical protein
VEPVGSIRLRVYLRILSLAPQITPELERAAIEEALVAGPSTAHSDLTPHPRGGYWLYLDIQPDHLDLLFLELQRRNLANVI